MNRIVRPLSFLIIAIFAGCVDWQPRTAPALTISEFFSGSTVTFTVAIEGTTVTSDTIRFNIYTESGVLSHASDATIEAGADTTVAVTDVADGAYELYVYISSGARLAAAADLPREIFVDTSSPDDPVLDTSSGSFALPIYVTLETHTSGLTTEVVHFTSDGSTPNASSPLFSSPYIVGTPGTLTLVRLDAAGNSSGDAAYTYSAAIGPQITIDNSDPVAATNTTVALTTTSTDTSIFLWSVESGASATFGTPAAANTTFTGATGVEESYIVRITGSDASGGSSFDEISILWDDLAPIVDAGSDTGTVGTAQTVSAWIVDAEIALVAWTSLPTGAVFGNAASATTTISGLAGMGQSYAVTATVTDSAGNVGSDTLTFDWDDTDPTTTITTANPVAWTNSFVSLVATSAGASTLLWEVAGGLGTFSTPTLLTTDFTGVAGAETEYILRLTGTDAAGNSSFDEITVQWDLLAPIASAGPNLTVNDSAEHLIAAFIQELGSDVASIAWTDPAAPTLNVTITDATEATVKVAITAAATSVTIDRP